MKKVLITSGLIALVLAGTALALFMLPPAAHAQERQAVIAKKVCPPSPEQDCYDDGK